MSAICQPVISRLVAFAMIATLAASEHRAAAQARCSSEPLMLQVLGSAGPDGGHSRASSGYLIWRDGRAVVMVDAGGGTLLRFRESGAQLRDLSLLAISHLHPDHVAELPALLWLSEVERERPLKIVGPSGAGDYPSFDTFLRRLFDPATGAFPILGGTLGQPGRGVRLDAVTVDASPGRSSRVFSDGGLEVTAFGVPHGPTPSIAYRVRSGDHSIVFGSDQNGRDPRFMRFAAAADVLVMHFGLSEQAADSIATSLARPSTVGEIARNARPKRLVLSHFIRPPALTKTPEWFSLHNLDAAVAQVRQRFSGPIDVAADLQCISVR